MGLDCSVLVLELNILHNCHLSTCRLGATLGKGSRMIASRTRIRHPSFALKLPYTPVNLTILPLTANQFWSLVQLRSPPKIASDLTNWPFTNFRLILEVCKNEFWLQKCSIHLFKIQCTLFSSHRVGVPIFPPDQDLGFSPCGVQAASPRSALLLKSISIVSFRPLGDLHRPFA